MSSDSDDWISANTAYAAVSVFEYQHGKMYISLFCQGESGDIYQLTGIYRAGTPMIIDNPTWEVTPLTLCDAEPANPDTPLASVVHYDGPGIPTVRLFYLDTSDYIREIVWINGEEVEKYRLPVKAASNSSLSAVVWKANNKSHIRLYYQSPAGVIEEYSKESGESWKKGSTLDFSRKDSNGKPLFGTALSFVSLPEGSPNLRGYWQASNSAIREVTYDGRTWKLSDWVISPEVSPTPIAAAWIGERKNPELVVYHIDEENKILQTKRDRSVTEVVDDVGVDSGSKLAVVNADSGFQVFATGGSSPVRRIAEEDLKTKFKAPKVLKIAKGSPFRIGMKPPPIIRR